MAALVPRAVVCVVVKAWKSAVVRAPMALAVRMLTPVPMLEMSLGERPAALLPSAANCGVEKAPIAAGVMAASALLDNAASAAVDSASCDVFESAAMSALTRPAAVAPNPAICPVLIAASAVLESTATELLGSAPSALALSATCCPVLSTLTRPVPRPAALLPKAAISVVGRTAKAAVDSPASAPLASAAYAALDSASS